MREIKFRAWDKIDKKMCCHIGISLYGVQIYEGDSFPEKIITDRGQNCFELMQYTGLKDRNGKEIYESDIMEVSKESIEYIGGSITKMVVGYKNGCFMAGRNNVDTLNTYLWLLAGDIGKCEVIGNIYENSELT